MKIAVVVPGGVDASGEVRVIPALLALFRRLSVRHDVHVFALRQQLEPGEWWLEGVRVHNIGGRSGALGQVRTVMAIAREHRVGRFDVVQSIWSGTCSAVALVAARLLRLPCAVHVAGGELVALADIGYGGLLSRRGRVRESIVLKRADVVTAASQPVLDQVAAFGREGRRLPLGVDLAMWPAQAPRRRQPDEPLRIVHVASLNRVKDQTCLLQAMARLFELGIDAELDVVGEDTLDGEIQALAHQLGLAERVRFHGFMTHKMLRPMLLQAHLLAITSRHEAGPLAVLEAAVMGVPTVGTSVGHLVEWAPNAALTVPPGDSAGLAMQMATLAGDEPRRLSLAFEAQRRALSEDADHTGRMFETLHQELVCAGV